LRGVYLDGRQEVPVCIPYLALLSFHEFEMGKRLSHQC
jgi:hypothetical protein